MQKIFVLKCITSAIALIGLVGHLLWPDIKIDAITLALFVITILPWLSPLIKTIKLPSGLEISLQEVKSAGEKISLAENNTESPSKSGFQEIVTKDPNLLLVALRIEIEKRLIALAEKKGITNEKSLSRLLRILYSEDTIDNQTFAGLSELIFAGNQAAHGAKVEESVSSWALFFGPQILTALDSKLNQTEPNSNPKWFEKARSTILSHGNEFVILCRTLLDLAVKDKFVHISPTSDKKIEAAQILVNLGALEEIEDRIDKYKLTDAGLILQKHL